MSAYPAGHYIVACQLRTTKQANHVTATLDLALTASMLDQMEAVHRPRVLTDSGSSYVAGDPADRLGSHCMPPSAVRRGILRPRVGTSAVNRTPF
ncbi:hypothetical protein MOTC310_24055 [Methylobacterium oryzae]|uniref:Transposase n=1 Tax=Methylobacterium oryzae TaxID=334852 RepID=A0ABU7TU30_9HYPH